MSPVNAKAQISFNSYKEEMERSKGYKKEKMT